MIVLLDSGPLGLVSNPRQSAEADACKVWLRALIIAGHRALVPAITDYEVRRELQLYQKTQGLSRFALDADVIRAAQAATLDAGECGQPGAPVVIATTNAGHLSRFADARLWRGIP